MQLLHNGNGGGACVTAKKLRRDIEQWLQGKVGVYLFSLNGTVKSVPAIAVLPDNQHGYAYPPEDTKISGLEVVLVRQTLSVFMLLNLELQKRYNWSIYLKCWDNNGDLVPAAEALIDGLSANKDYLFTSPVEIPPSEEFGMVPTVKVQLSDWIHHF